jgi:hypothetical protein
MDEQTTAPGAIPNGKLDGPPPRAAASVRQPKEKDAKTLRYDWFLHIGKTVREVGDPYSTDRMSGPRRSRRADP